MTEASPVRLRRFTALNVLIALLAAVLLLLAAVGPWQAPTDARAAEPGVPVVYVTTGTKFPDALAGGPLGGLTGGPILLVTRDTIPAPTLAELQRLEPLSIVILGGPEAVSAAVAGQLAGLTAGAVTRIEGTDRFDTAAQISQVVPSRAHDAELLQGMGPEAFLAAEDAEMFASSDQFIPFAVGMSFGDADEVVLEQGPLQFLVRCRQEGGNDIVEIVAASAQNGVRLAFGNAELNAGDEEIVMNQSVAAGTTQYVQRIDRTSMVAPDGSYLAYQQEVTGVGLNVLGQDCLVAGIGFAQDMDL